MKIGKAATKGALSSPLFKTSWNLRSDQELLDLYITVIEKMEEKPYGMWEAVNLIFGRQVADRMADQQEFKGVKLPKGILMKIDKEIDDETSGSKASGSKGETIDYRKVNSGKGKGREKSDDMPEISPDERRYEKRQRL